MKGGKKGIPERDLLVRRKVKASDGHIRERI
jgi:hypothetical protein